MLVSGRVINLNKALLGDDGVLHNPLIRPYFLRGGGGLGRVRSRIAMTVGGFHYAWKLPECREG